MSKPCPYDSWKNSKRLPIAGHRHLDAIGGPGDENIYQMQAGERYCPESYSTTLLHRESKVTCDSLLQRFAGFVAKVLLLVGNRYRERGLPAFVAL